MTDGYFTGSYHAMTFNPNLCCIGRMGQTLRLTRSPTIVEKEPISKEAQDNKVTKASFVPRLSHQRATVKSSPQFYHTMYSPASSILCIMQLEFRSCAVY